MILALVTIPIMAGLISGNNLTSTFYLWSGPFWPIWYLLASVFLSEPSTAAGVTATIMDSSGAPTPSIDGRIARGAR
jgi:hypothetical protein